MSARRSALPAAAIVLLAFTLDAGLGQRLTVMNVRPDLAIAALVPAALAVRAGSAAWLGLAAGILKGSFIPLAPGSYAVSRALAGWTTGLLEERLFRDNLFVTMVAGVLASLVADGSFFFFAPQPDALRYLLLALGRALYTALLVVPCALVIRKIYPAPA